VLVALVPDSVQKVINSTGYMTKYLFWMTVSMACFSALWLLMPIQYKLYTLFFVFPALGFVIGGLGPYSIRLVESITPVSGGISCIFMMLYGAGDFLIVFVNGELIQKYGAMIQPAAICAYCLFVIPVVAVAVCLYRRYQRVQAEIVGISKCITIASHVVVEGKSQQSPSDVASTATTSTATPSSIASEGIDAESNHSPSSSAQSAVRSNDGSVSSMATSSENDNI
jgi:hypothetical protein